MSTTSYKSQPAPIRQHGFHLPSPPREDDMVEFEHNFRQPALDFSTDELVSLQDYPRTTHNIFDISAPTHRFALVPQQHQQHQHQQVQQHQQQQQHMHDSSRLDFPTHFNSTLPALNSSMRYEPHPDPPVFRPDSRSRSTSRPPTATNIGPVRTRRGNSVSSVSSGPSPPPIIGRPHPHAIVIPGGQRPNTSSWISSSGPDPYSLPTPDSLHSPSLLSAQHGQYSPFGFSPHEHSSYQQAMSPVTGAMNGLAFHHHPQHIQQQQQQVQQQHHQQSPVTPTPSSIPVSLSTPAPSSSATPSTSSASASATNATAASSSSGQTVAEKLANEKRRRRRESHNAVERRRRDNINERIGELATLIPECMLNDGTTGASDELEEGHSPKDSTNGRNPNSGMKKGDDGVVKANKGMILRKSVDYIRYLQELVDAQGARNRQLEMELKAYRTDDVRALSTEWMQVDQHPISSFIPPPPPTTNANGANAFQLGSDQGSPLTQIEEDESEDSGELERGRRVKREA